MLARICNSFTRTPNYTLGSGPEPVVDTIESEPNGTETPKLIKKNGVVKTKRKDWMTVEAEGDIYKFSLDDVVHSFIPRTLDHIILMCEFQPDSTEDELPFEVRQIEPPKVKTIIGNITSVQTQHSGTIDERYLFFWDVLSNDYECEVNDRVTAEVIQCETVDENDCSWRCLNVALLEPRALSWSEKTKNLPIDQSTANKNGIEIDEVTVEFNYINETKDFKMKIANTSDQEFRVVESVLAGKKMDSQLELISPLRKASFLLRPSEVKSYKFTATSKFFGKAPEEFIVRFKAVAKDSVAPFQIHRYITVDVHDTERQHNTIGTGPNVHRNRDYTHSIATRDLSFVLRGTPLGATPNFVCKKFGPWPLPSALTDIVLGTATSHSRAYIFDTLATVCKHLNEPLTMTNYSQTFHDLLYLEELEIMHSMRKYDKKSFFTRKNEYLVLAIQNVAESRPSIVLGDYVIAIEANPKDKPVQRKGFIHEVKQNELLINFDEGFRDSYENEDYEITFHFSRNSLIKQHEGIELAAKALPLVLFPSDDIRDYDPQIDVVLNAEKLQCGTRTLPWFNESLNAIQRQAVTNILRGVARPMPYVIFGPPGTGKTVTLIETILQLVKNLPHSRVLVATPSNSSANLITERIIESEVLKPREFIRLVSHNNVHRETIPQKIISQCGTIHKARDGTDNEYTVKETGIQLNCGSSRLKSYRVLIGTCITLGTLMQCDIPEDHFTHVVIDESGQSLESELIIPMTFVDKQIGQIILAGDPKQLGPIVLSHFAKTLGLNRSYLVRLLERSPYKPDPERFENRYNPRLVTRLVFNYRSLPTIMNVYSDLFYDEDLKAMVNDSDSDEAKMLKKLSPHLPNYGQRKVTEGVFFISVTKGKNEKSSDSPSWYNKEEAQTAVKFYKKLIAMGQSVDDIGIITPYTQQVKLIRAELTKASQTVPKVGTVEEFQGQERKIILLSTVRTTQRDHQREDLKYSLGFVRSPERMNVAISRARALLVIFGSDKLLSRDKDWKFLIDNCKQNKTFDGDMMDFGGNDSE